MFYLLQLLVNTLIVGLFLYSKLLPYKANVSGQYKQVFDFFESIFKPALDGLRSFIKPFQVGQGLSVDMTQIVLLILLLFINNFF